MRRVLVVGFWLLVGIALTCVWQQVIGVWWLSVLFAWSSIGAIIMAVSIVRAPYLPWHD